MSQISRQDIQVIADISRNRIMERMATRNDMAMILEVVKNTLSICQHNQQLLRQSEQQRVQSDKRVAALEAQVASARNEVKILSHAVAQAAEQQPQQIIVPLPHGQYEEDANHHRAGQYGYYQQA